MDIFLNPNVVYLLLVLGFFLAILALFSPGTGMLEAGALLILIAAGWGVYNNARPINLWALIVLAIGVFPFLLAMRKWRDVIFLAIAIVAFELGSVYLFVPEVWWKPAVNPFLAGSHDRLDQPVLMDCRAQSDRGRSAAPQPRSGHADRAGGRGQNSHSHRGVCSGGRGTVERLER